MTAQDRAEIRQMLSDISTNNKPASASAMRAEYDSERMAEEIVDLIKIKYQSK